MQALLELCAHSPHNEVRGAAQSALEPLQLHADVLTALLQTPSLGPPTPTPVHKRAKKSKDIAAAQAATTPASVQGVTLAADQLPITHTGNDCPQGRIPAQFAGKSETDNKHSVVL